MAEFPEFAVESWGRLASIAEQFDSPDPLKQAYVFRGQPDFSWSLQTTLRRAATNEGRKTVPDTNTLLQLEQWLLERFLATAPNHLPASTIATTNAHVDWWPLMRHFGVPTRILDWTKSFYVGAYFAAAAEPEKDGAIYLFHLETLTRAMVARHGDLAKSPTGVRESDRAFLDANAPPIFEVFNRKTALLDRMIVQQSVCMTNRNVATEFEPVLANALVEHGPEGKEAFRKLRIPASLKPQIMCRLRSMNVTASSLFPGLDGIGRYLDESIRYRQ